VVVVSVIAWTTAISVPATGFVHPLLPVPAASAFAAVLAGALLHIGLDILAVPGLPLLAPFSDRKYTAGFLPGPSILLMADSLFFLIWMSLGGIGLSAMALMYAAIFAAFITVRLAAFCSVRTTLHGTGRAVPAINPLRWLVIGEVPDAWTVAEYRIGKGLGDREYLMKYQSTSAEEIAALLIMPEVRRFLFHSYLVTAEKVGDEIVFSDPLRESRRIFYPPHYTRVCIHLADPSGM
jgi:inner membrane protein